MSERRLSKRSQRRLRLQVAQRLAGSTVSVSTKKPRIEPTTAFTDHGAEDGDDAEDQEPQREVEATADSIGENRESCGDVDGAEDVEGRLSGDDNPSESGSSAGQHRVSDGELSERVTDFSEDDKDLSEDEGDFSEEEGGSSEGDFSKDDCSSNEDMIAVRSVATGTHGPLFQDSAVQSDDFNTAFLSLAQRHNLTYSSQGDILKLLSIVLPSPSYIPSSAHVLYKKYSNYKEDTVVQHFCDNCTCPLEPGSSCKQQKCAKASRGVFVRIPLRMQLKERFDGMFMRCFV